MLYNLATCQQAPSGKTGGASRATRRPFQISRTHNLNHTHNSTQQHTTTTQDTGCFDHIYTGLKTEQQRVRYLSNTFLAAEVPACEVTASLALELLCTLEFVVDPTTLTTRLRRVVFVAFYDLHVHTSHQG